MAESQKRVLIMDDYPDAADTLAALVRLCGHTPFVAYDAESALRIAHENELDVFILDLALPVSSGYEVASQLRAEPLFRQALMIALTGFDDLETHRRALSVGFDLHIGKPISYVEVTNILDNSDELMTLARSS